MKAKSAEQLVMQAESAVHFWSHQFFRMVDRFFFVVFILQLITMFTKNSK